MKRVLCLMLTSFSFFLFSCDKENGFATPKGGDLPTNYIFIKDSAVTPSIMSVVKGSSVTFVNQSSISHSFRSFDTTTIVTGVIAPDRSFFFKKDTTGSFPYYCEQHPNVTGIIIITE